MESERALRSVTMYSWEDFEEDAKYLAGQIRDNGILESLDSIYGIPRGGSALAQRLAYLLNLRIVEKSEISQGTLLVDDIADSGKTLREYLDRYPACHTASLFYNLISSVRPEFFARVKWISFPWSKEEDLGIDKF